MRTRPTVKAKVDSGYQGLAKEFPGQVGAPPKKPADEACDGDKHAWQKARRRQSSARTCVEHTNAGLHQWAALRRSTRRRDTYAETHLAIAGFVSDRSAQRATRRQTSTELVLARDTAC
ncbi:transposase [Streptomyces sp. TG1A-60]|uniref:transposase n=1 Tax=Streptomyces sp. TG1A-60 TaxID=3129111 RepID=UPI0030CA781F